LSGIEGLDLGPHPEDCLSPIAIAAGLQQSRWGSELTPNSSGVSRLCGFWQCMPMPASTTVAMDYDSEVTGQRENNAGPGGWIVGF